MITHEEMKDMTLIPDIHDLQTCPWLLEVT